MNINQMLSNCVRNTLGRKSSKRQEKSSPTSSLVKKSSQKHSPRPSTQPGGDYFTKPLIERAKCADSNFATGTDTYPVLGKPADLAQGGVGAQSNIAGFSNQKATVALSIEETAEAIAATQAAIDGKYPLQDAMDNLDALIAKVRNPEQLLLTRALLKFDLKDTVGCVLDCRTVLRVAPNNALARMYETVALHAECYRTTENVRVAIDNIIAGREFAKRQGSKRLAIIVRNAATPKLQSTVEEIAEVTELYKRDATDQCVAALLAIMHYRRWLSSGDSKDAEPAITIAKLMNKTWASDKIALSILHHTRTLMIVNEIPVFKSPELFSVCPSDLYGAISLQPNTILGYPLSIFDPQTKYVLGSYIKNSFNVGSEDGAPLFDPTEKPLARFDGH